MIDIVNISKSYKIGRDSFRAVDGLSLTVETGDFISIVGHSGSGKTTLLSLIGGLTRPDSGTVVIDNTDLWAMSDNELSEFRNKKINFIFQFSSLIPTLNVLENVLLPSAFGQNSDPLKERAIKLLEKVRLPDRLDSYPSQLSGGQQRRVAIARAFINNPSIILADEPTGDLDEDTEQEIIKLFHTMNEEQGITFVIVTHSSDIARQCCRNQYRMHQGILTRE
jgi:putative ABC transport system ATP-binding protein/lipoprotein-releasing system ATP-binding protein